MKVLGSYHYFRRENMLDWHAQLSRLPSYQFFADSGAWSAMNSGSHIRFAEYEAWLRQWSHLFAAYCNLDVMTDHIATRRNHEAMVVDGFNPVAVVHMGEPLDALRWYCDNGYTYLGLGRMVGRPTAAVMRWLGECFDIAAAYPEVVFHGFGLTRAEVLLQLPFFSVDSSSFTQARRFGMLRLFDGRGHYTAFHWRDRKEVYRNAELIRSYGVDPADLLNDHRRWNLHLSTAISAMSWARIEAHARKLHGHIELAGHKPGLHLYLSGVVNDFRSIMLYTDLIAANTNEDV